jgi:ATP-dependent DNA helicase Rep
LAYKPGFSIFDGEDAKALIRDLMMKDGDENTDQINFYQMEISNWKNAMMMPDKAIQYAKSPEELVIANIYKVYDRYLKAYNALDFDDLILKPVVLFNENPEVLSKWRKNKILVSR